MSFFVSLRWSWFYDLMLLCFYFIFVKAIYLFAFYRRQNERFSWKCRLVLINGGLVIAVHCFYYCPVLNHKAFPLGKLRKRFQKPWILTLSFLISRSFTIKSWIFWRGFAQRIWPQENLEGSQKRICHQWNHRRRWRAWQNHPTSGRPTKKNSRVSNFWGYLSESSGEDSWVLIFHPGTLRLWVVP